MILYLVIKAKLSKANVQRWPVCTTVVRQYRFSLSEERFLIKRSPSCRATSLERWRRVSESVRSSGIAQRLSSSSGSLSTSRKLRLEEAGPLMTDRCTGRIVWNAWLPTVCENYFKAKYFNVIFWLWFSGYWYSLLMLCALSLRVGFPTSLWLSFAEPCVCLWFLRSL